MWVRLEPFARALSLGRRYPPFWWYPSLALVAGLLLGAALGRISAAPPGWSRFLVYAGDADAARTFVSLAVTSLATITTLSLTLTVVSLQLASSRYSPRLIEHYLSDAANHAVFSLFFGTFAFAVATLLNVRSPGGDEAGRVPSVSVSFLVALLALCLVALVVFVHRVTTSMRVESILRRVRDRTIEAVELRPTGSADDDPTTLPHPPEHAAVIRSRRSGYYAAYDRDAIERFHPAEPCRVWIVPAPGDFVTEGSPIALVAGRATDSVRDTVESWLRFDAERWIESDFSYGIRSLLDVALAGVSPGVNDPTTATMAIDRIGESLAVAGRHHAERAIRTEAGTEVFLAIREWDDIVRQAVRQIVEYGGRDVAVATAVIRMLAGLAWAESDLDRRPSLRSVAGELRAWLALGPERAGSDREVIDDELALLERALRGESAVPPPAAVRRHPL